jgi:hypothetical protein
MLRRNPKLATYSTDLITGFDIEAGGQMKKRSQVGKWRGLSNR